MQTKVFLLKSYGGFFFEETGSDICAGFSRLGTLEFMNFEERLDVAWISQNWKQWYNADVAATVKVLSAKNWPLRSWLI